MKMPLLVGCRGSEICVNEVNIFCLGFFENESKLKDSFLKVADTERDRFQFAYSSDPAVLKETGYSEYVQHFLFNNLIFYVT